MYIICRSYLPYMYTYVCENKCILPFYHHLTFIFVYPVYYIYFM